MRAERKGFKKWVITSMSVVALLSVLTACNDKEPADSTVIAPAPVPSESVIEDQANAPIDEQSTVEEETSATEDATGVKGDAVSPSEDGVVEEPSADIEVAPEESDVTEEAPAENTDTPVGVEVLPAPSDEPAVEIEVTTESTN